MISRHDPLYIRYYDFFQLSLIISKKLAHSEVF